MAKRRALDIRFAIADAFDSGTLRGDCTVNQIADAVGARRDSIGRTLRVVGFHPVRRRQPLYNRIPARWDPPRNWPQLKRHSPLTKALVELYHSGRWSGRCYARDLAPLLEASEKAVAHALRRLRFRIVKKSHLKFVRMEPAVWAPPKRWPEIFQKQRELKLGGLSTGQVIGATDLSAQITGLIDDAVRRLDIEDILLYKPGALKAKIREAVQDVYRQARLDNVTRQDLASWLGERPDANVQYLQTRVKGYVRFASRRTCPHCGRNVAAERQIIGLKSS